MLCSVPPSPSSCPELPVIADLGYRKILPIQQMHLVIDIACCCRNLWRGIPDENDENGVWDCMHQAFYLDIER